MEPILSDVPVITEYIQRLADNRPDHVVAEIAEVPRLGVTSSQLVRAVDSAASWLEHQVPQCSNVALIAEPQDLRYLIFSIAAFKVKSLTATMTWQSISEQHPCPIILHPAEHLYRSHVRDLCTKFDVTARTIPDLRDLLQARTPKHSRGKLERARDVRETPFVGLHTSGSTGLPKPVVLTHGFVMATEHFRTIPQVQSSIWEGKRMLLAFPLSHAAGLNFIFSGLQSGSTVVLPPPGQPISAPLLSRMLTTCGVKVACIPPSIMDELAVDDISAFTDLQWIVTGGGPLKKDTGDMIIAKGSRVFNAYGSSETGALPLELVGASDWQYMRFSPACGAHMQHFDDELYELVIKRDLKYDDFQVVFHASCGIDEWRTHDLFRRHPSHDDLWLWSGRTDDVIVYSNGRKFNPVGMERSLNSSPHIERAVLYGTGKPESALLLEGTDKTKNTEEIVELIWPAIEEANQAAPYFARVPKGNILVGKIPKVPQSTKDTFPRKAVLDLHRRELDALYPTGRGRSTGKGSLRVSPQIIIGLLRQEFDLEVQPEQDMFEVGLDSSQVVKFASILRDTLSSHHAVTLRAISSNPTPSLLAEYLTVGRGNGSDAGSFDYMSSCLHQALGRCEAKVKPPGKVVMLTGSTGALGSYLLHMLRQDQTITKIFCLNRNAAAAERQVTSLRTKGLSEGLASATVTYVQADLGQDDLCSDKYRERLPSVTHVLHNAWEVNFQKPLHHFVERDCKGVENIARFCQVSRASLFFVSSVGAVVDWHKVDTNATFIPEVVTQDQRCAPPSNGYGQSKLLAEQILDAVAPKYQVPTIICRVGQLAGPTSTEGEWPKHEWLPSLVQSSYGLKCLPATLGRLNHIDWIPIDQAAQVIKELFDNEVHALSTYVQVRHVVHPRPTTWSQLLPEFQRALGMNKYATATLEEWVSKVRAVGNCSIDQNPAAKLADFFESQTRDTSICLPMETTGSCLGSPTLRQVRPLTGADIDRWTKQWQISSMHDSYPHRWMNSWRKSILEHRCAVVQIY